MSSNKGYKEKGEASWYGKKFHGRKTANGEIYDMYKMTAAHKTLQIPSYVKVRNLENGREIIVRVNDRGPFHGDRIIDLSYAAATKLDMLRKGTARVEVTALDPNDPKGANGKIKYQKRYVQVAAYGNKSDAKKVADRLRNQIDEPVVLQKTNWHRILVGPLDGMTEVKRVIEKVERLGWHGAYMVKY